MAQLEKESQKSTKLEQKINEIEKKEKSSDGKDQTNPNMVSNNEFGSWILEKEFNEIDLSDRPQIQAVITKGNTIYEYRLKKSLRYFHERFKILFDKMTSTSIQASDDLNKWSIKEEQYKAQIENLKAQLIQKDDEDLSNDSSGLIEIPSITFLQRKCCYLEECYKYIRTLIENVKNEELTSKKEMMVMSFDYECRIQKLIIAVASLTDKLRSSVPIDMFWKQNLKFNEALMKYRYTIDNMAKTKDEKQALLKHFEENKLDILNTIQNDSSKIKKIEEFISEKQIQQLCVEIESKNKIIENLEHQNKKLQESQANIM